jgi:hypothetical protein
MLTALEQEEGTIKVQQSKIQQFLFLIQKQRTAAIAPQISTGHYCITGCERLY